MEEWMTPKQAAERKGVTLSAIYKAVKENRIPSEEVLGRIALRTADIDAYEPGSYGDTKRMPRQRGPGRKKRNV